MSPRVSICLPTFNGERYIESALESILCQSFDDFELIICDDSSTDSTFEIVEKYAKQDSRISAFRNSCTHGLFENYNRCLQRARGELIKPFAQDDLLHPDMVKQCVDVFERESEVVLTCVARALVNDAGQLVKAEIATADQIAEPGVAVPGYKVIQDCLYPVINYIGEPSTVMFRSRAKGDGFDTSLRHLGDIEYWLRILMEGDLFHIGAELCYFRWHDESTSAANARGLLIGPDLVRMSKKLSWVFETCGQTEDDFLYASITAFGGYVQALSESGTISVDYLREAVDLRSGVPDELMDNPIVANLVKDLVDFRELAFHSLRLVGVQAGSIQWTNNSNAAIGENHRLIESLEGELRNLLQSKSWHMTRLLREISRAAASGGTGEVVYDEYEMDASGDILEQQQQYIGYLRELITRVKLSRSWKITKPFRDLDRFMQPSKSGA